MNKISNTDGSASITHYNDGYAKAREKIKCINIKDVLKMEKFDCLECDIEGAEWDIIKYFLKNKKEWTFKKAVIELHFSYMNFDTELHIMNNFLNWLEGKNFKCSFYYSPEEIKEHKKFSDFDILPTPERTRRPIMLYIEKIGDSEYLAI